MFNRRVKFSVKIEVVFSILVLINYFSTFLYHFASLAIL